MSAPVAQVPPTLSYQVPFREERLEDGTLRLTLTTDRSAAMRSAAVMGVVSLLGLGLLVAAWLVTGSIKALVFGLILGPLGAMFAGGVLVSLKAQPKTRIYVVEVGPAGFTLDAGGAVFENRRHALAEIVAVKSNDMALEVYTTKRGCYSCLQFIGAKRLRVIEELVNPELSKLRSQ